MIVKAGMISEVESRQLVIALEPEAASFFCRQLDMSKFERKLCFPSGTKFMILDCGGSLLLSLSPKFLIASFLN